MAAEVAEGRADSQNCAFCCLRQMEVGKPYLKTGAQTLKLVRHIKKKIATKKHPHDGMDAFCIYDT